jgi:enoyl-CoA hydratase/carnithine racemase
MIRVSTDGPIRTITLARPDKRNALDAVMLTDLAAAFLAPATEGERVTVLRAEGPAFCAGLDLRIRQADGAPEGASPVEAVLEAVDNSPLPVVAAVGGPAVAGGCELALAADLVVAAEQATFAMPLARLGTAPTWELTARLVSRLGTGPTRELLLTGAPMRAERLAAVGAVTVAPDFTEAVDRAVAAVAACAPLAVGAIRATMHRITSAIGATEHADIAELIAAVRRSEDAVEGVAANRERRPARFRGR